MIVCLAAAAMAVGCKSGSGNRAAAPDRLDPERPRDAVDLYLDAMRVDLVYGKTRLINDVMRLSEEEDDIFWEIYRQFEEEYFAIGDRRLEALREFVDRTRQGTLDDASAHRIATTLLGERDEMTALLRRYHDRISTELSPIRATQFLQIEHRAATVVDLVIASEVPLLRSN
jgi:hypothetical protein